MNISLFYPLLIHHFTSFVFGNVGHVPWKLYFLFTYSTFFSMMMVHLKQVQGYHTKTSIM